MAVKWEFYDPETDESYVFEVNPSGGGSPQYMKKMNYQTTSAVDGLAIAFEGRQEAQQSSFTGTVLSKDQYDAMVAWFNKRHAVQYTDDLNRTLSIYITSFEPQRQRALHYPWKHTYTVKYMVLSITEHTIQ